MEAQVEHLARGIVNGSDQAEFGSTLFQPVMRAAIHLQKHSLGLLALPSLPPDLPGFCRLCWFLFFEHPVQGGAAQADAVALLEQLLQMASVEVLVGAPRP